MPRDHASDRLIERMMVDGGDIVLTGPVTPEMARDLHSALHDADPQGEPLIVELTTNGGDADIGVRMMTEIARARRRLAGRRLVFLGTGTVYSAGVTTMSAFPAADRFLTAGGTLLVHGRQLAKTVELSGPLRASRPQIKALLSEIEVGCALENDGFRRLIEGSDIDFAEVCEKALYNWYIPAEEALGRGLIAGIV